MLSKSQLLAASALRNCRSVLSMPAVMVTGATVMQNSPFSRLAVSIAVASTHCAYPLRDGEAELTRVAGYIKVVPYSITSVGHGVDPGFLAVSLQAMLVMNPVVGCRYFPPGPWLLSCRDARSVRV